MAEPSRNRLVVEVLPHAGLVTFHRYVFDQPEIRIGRAYSNDVIVNDPHVSSHHLTLVCSESGGWTLHDCNSLNGVVLNETRKVETSHALVSGDDIAIGRTRIRVFQSDHVVDPAVPLLPGVKALQKLGDPGIGGLIFLSAMLLMAGFSWMEMWSAEPNVQMMATTLVPAVLLLVWASGWSVVSRLIRHKARFTAHLSVGSLYLMASLAAYYLESYVRFLSGESVASTVLSHALSAALLYFLLKLHLRMATHMTVRRRRMIAAAFAVGLVIGVLGVSHLSRTKFESAPEFSWELKPYLTGLAPEQSIDAHLADMQGLFVKARKEAAKK